MISILVFLSVSLGVVAGYLLLADVILPDEAKVRRRVDEEFRLRQRDQVRTSPLFKDLGKFNLDRPAYEAEFEAAGPTPAAADGLEPGWRPRLARLITDSGVSVKPERVLTVAGVTAVLLGATAWLALGPWAAGLGAAAGAYSPFFYLVRKRTARREKFLRQLPDAFELMARVIRAGHSIPQSLQSVADSLEQPIAGEFSYCQEQQNLGLLPEVTYRDLARRTGVLEMKIFVMAMLIQRQTGGNLSDVLERLAALVRERLRLRTQVRTLTAEGRMQAAVLLGLPPVMFVAMMVLNRRYAEALFDHPSLIGGMVALMAVGVLWIRRIVNFEI